MRGEERGEFSCNGLFVGVLSISGDFFGVLTRIGLFWGDGISGDFFGVLARKGLFWGDGLNGRAVDMEFSLNFPSSLSRFVLYRGFCPSR